MSKKANPPINENLVILNDKPRPVIDQAAYDEYLKLMASPIVKKRFYEATDGSIIDLSWFPHIMQRKTEHLQPTEQAKFMKLKEIYSNIIRRANGMKKKAFTVYTIGSEGETKESLFHHRKGDLLELFGRMFTTKEVYQIASNDWKLKCNLGQLHLFRNQHIDQIIAKIEEHKRTYSDIRLGHKRSRLEELTWLYMKRKAIYNTSNKADDHRLLIQTIEQIRKEAEGDKITLDGNISHNIDGAIESLIEKDLTKNLSIKELILARVSAKTGTPVAKLVADLSKGWYSKILNRTAEEAQIEIDYPSTQTYDFDNIARVAAANELRLKNEVKVIVNPEIVKAGVDIKALLLSKLNAKKGDVQAEKNDLNPMFIDKANNYAE